MLFHVNKRKTRTAAGAIRGIRTDSEQAVRDLARVTCFCCRLAQGHVRPVPNSPESLELTSRCSTSIRAGREKAAGAIRGIRADSEQAVRDLARV